MHIPPECIDKKQFCCIIKKNKIKTTGKAETAMTSHSFKNASGDGKASSIVNIINFIRSVEPRMEMDLFEPVREQMALAKKHNLPTTWLIQYDALITPPYADFLKREMPEDHEVGIWLECVQPLVEAAGIPWRGRWAWDWFANVDATAAYTPEERERIVDVFMAKFKETFGHLPESAGCWYPDAHTLNYLHEKYGVRAACCCRDQYGTDGYTLWGGYWANGYYPSKKNFFMPAQTPQEQINLPLFRMLGSDPLYQYDAGIGDNGQGVVTLEPVYTGADGGGGIPEWVKWFLRENFRSPHLAMAYAQVGQENSFGWAAMKDGLIFQYAELERLQKEGLLRVETLAATGKWFRSKFASTPASAVLSLNDWKELGHQGIWYCSKHGRINLFRTESGELTVRDWQFFDENREGLYLHSVCTTTSCFSDALPVMDGFLWNPASIRFPGGPGEIKSAEELPEDSLQILWSRKETSDEIAIQLHPSAWEVRFPKAGEVLEFMYNAKAAAEHGSEIKLESGKLKFRHSGWSYAMIPDAGSIEQTEHGFLLIPEGNVLRLHVETEL